MSVEMDTANVIAAFSLFADLGGPELEQVVHVFEESWFVDGEPVLRQGLTGSGFYVIVEGSASIRVNGVDRATLGPGDYFGEISAMLGEAPVADIVARGQLRCLVLPAARLEEFLKSHPKIMFRLLQGETRKLRNTTRWLS